jgi:hypothetical protein
MMDYRTTLELVLASGLVLLGVYDVAAYLIAGHDATVTAAIRDWTHKWPVVAFAAGFLAGHLFWQ